MSKVLTNKSNYSHRSRSLHLGYLLRLASVLEARYVGPAIYWLPSHLQNGIDLGAHCLSILHMLSLIKTSFPNLFVSTWCPNDVQKLLWYLEYLCVEHIIRSKLCSMINDCSSLLTLHFIMEGFEIRPRLRRVAMLAWDEVCWYVGLGLVESWRYFAMRAACSLARESEVMAEMFVLVVVFEA